MLKSSWYILAVVFFFIVTSTSVGVHVGSRKLIASSGKFSSSRGSATSGLDVRLQLEDLEQPDIDTVSAVQRDDDVIVSVEVAPSPSGTLAKNIYECLPLTQHSELSTICRHSTARYPDHFNHTDERQSTTHFRQSIGNLRNVLLADASPAPASAAYPICRAHLTAFVCAMYSPSCSKHSHVTKNKRDGLVPCRQLCEMAYNRCINENRRASPSRDWPTEWNCQQLPVDWLCDDINALHDVHIPSSGSAQTVLRLAPPAATLPLPPRTPFDSPSPSSVTRHRQRSLTRWRTRGDEINSTRHLSNRK